MWFIAIPLMTTFLACSLTAAAIPALRTAGILDSVNHRSSHTSTTARGGGSAVLIAFAIGTATALLFGPAPVRLSGTAVVALAAITAYGMLGWLEDTVGLPVHTRLLLQSGIAVVASIAAAGLGAEVALPTGAALIAVFYVNAANFMDGVNGISSLHAITSGIYFFFVGQQLGNDSLSLVALCGAGAFLGFLPWNFPAAKVFLGDVGSYTLGAFVWVLSFWAARDATLVVAAAPMVVYATDVLTTLARRARRREPLAEAHREHVYQRVEQASGSHATSALVVTAATLLTCSAGWLVLVGRLPSIAAVLIWTGTAVAFHWSPTICRRAKGMRV